MELKIGESVLSDAGITYFIREYVGGGGQGEVYKIVSDFDGTTPYALKWYFRDTATPVQKETLKRVINNGTPDKNFLWPFSFVYSDRLRESYGYVMNLREDRFKSLSALMKGQLDNDVTLHSLCTAGYNLAESFLKIHGKGFFYCDINFGNVFFDPLNGDIAICDNDNVTIEGAQSGVLGTGGFMAPEIVRGETSPNVHTDLHSLSVLFFYLFFRCHSLEGKLFIKYILENREDKLAEELYGTNPLYIFHPEKNENFADSEHNKYALVMKKILPTKLMGTFETAFTKGLSDRNKRVRESVWRNIMLEVRDSIAICSCGSDNFFDFIDYDKTNSTGTCWNCKNSFDGKFYLSTGRRNFMLNKKYPLYKYHISGGKEYDFVNCNAMITTKPDDPAILGIKNMTDTVWDCTVPEKGNQKCIPGRSIKLQDGLLLNFNNGVEGKIKIIKPEG
jgi:eukaryotic-like serine/threonine-protein kinase